MRALGRGSEAARGRRPPRDGAMAREREADRGGPSARLRHGYVHVEPRVRAQDVAVLEEEELDLAARRPVSSVRNA